MGSTYVIGDIHGCFETLQALWPRLRFDSQRDRLWLVGDLINRGPQSLEVLRWARELDDRLGDRMQVVLGNHDLHLLALYDGYAKQRAKDTLDTVLAAPDSSTLITWLAHRPLIHRDGGFVLVHAGLLPQWTVAVAERLAGELEPVLRDPSARRSLIERSGTLDRDASWRQPRANLAAFVGLRSCTVAGEPCPWKGPPADAPDGCLPWFEVPGRRSSGSTIVFGHWAAMGLRIESTAIGLDSGCVWGQQLTAIRLEDRVLFQQSALEAEPLAFRRA